MTSRLDSLAGFDPFLSDPSQAMGIKFVAVSKGTD